MDLVARAIYEDFVVFDSLSGWFSLHVRNECDSGTTNVQSDPHHRLPVGWLPWPLFHLDALWVRQIYDNR